MTAPKHPKSKKAPKTIDDLIAEKTKTFAKSSSKNKASTKRRPKRARRVQKSLVDLMGPPPLLSDEDPAQYLALYQTLRLTIDPRTVLEEIYVRHIMDDAWLVTRYRRMNAHILNMARPGLGDEIRLNIDRYRNSFMGSEELMDLRNENEILLRFSQYACVTHPSDMVARQFEKRIVEINIIEGMISRCMERMRRSHMTLEEARAFLDHALEVVSQDGADAEEASPSAQGDLASRGTQSSEECDSDDCDAANHDCYDVLEGGLERRSAQGPMGGHGHDH